MVRSIGIDPGDHTVKVVELEGSYRKTRLLRVHTAQAGAAADPAARAGVLAGAAASAREEGMRGEACLGYPCRESVLRVIELPFKGRDAIRKVVKAEIEGEIFSHTVDDMVVDFHEVGSSPDGSKVLVAAVPKPGLRALFAALEHEKIEVEHVDLDAMALYRAAHWAGAFAATAGAGADRPAAEPAATPALAVSIVLDLGGRSTLALVVEGDNLVDMRTLRLGGDGMAEEVAQKHGLPLGAARHALLACLASGSDYRAELQAPEAVADVEAPKTQVPAQVPATVDAPKFAVITYREAKATQTAFLQRLARELVRFLTSTGIAGRVQNLWITGSSSRLDGTSEMLREVFAVDARELDILGKLSHDLPPEEAETLAPRLAVPVGLALAAAGGPDGFSLRQEDLTFARGFDRIKFALAITCMLGLFALLIYGVKLNTELSNLELYVGRLYTGKNANPKQPQFYGMLHSVLSSKWFEDRRNFQYEPSKGKEYAYRELIKDIIDKPVAERIRFVHDKLRLVADKKQAESGVYEDVTIESGLAVLVRAAQILHENEAALGRYLLGDINLDLSGQKQHVLELMVAFRGEDFRTRVNALRSAFDADAQRADSPFERCEEPREELFKNTKDSGVSGAYYKVRILCRSGFAPFGPASGAARVGAAEPRERTDQPPADQSKPVAETDGEAGK